MYVLTSFPLGSSVEEHVKSTELNEEEHPSSSTPGELSLPQRSLWSQGSPTSCRTDRREGDLNSFHPVRCCHPVSPCYYRLQSPLINTPVQMKN